jgi:hypothetical protein
MRALTDHGAKDVRVETMPDPAHSPKLVLIPT